ncbi:MAG: fatty acid desaturase [Planctomycetes bacterium]|nr:fatty acid desaturase [Planctomycetota bacterium]
MSNREPAGADPAAIVWKPLVSAFTTPRTGHAIRQLADTVLPYLAVWVAIVFLAPISWWLCLPLCALNGALLVRAFIIFHDCGHGSFFHSKWANTFWGIVTGVLTFTPYTQWHSQHRTHHGSSGNLDRRGVGDFWTMTVREYNAASVWKRAAYRIARNPIVLLFVAPLVMFCFEQRIAKPKATRLEQFSVWYTNLMLGGIIVGMGFAMGFLAFIVMQLVVLAIAGAIGIWLFYLQHQFDGVYWQRAGRWSYTDAALVGSSYLKLPRVLQWFTGNIGFHHIHHLHARIPNYNLQACHESHPMFLQVRVMTFWGAIKAFGLKLWDEAEERLVCFREAKRLRQAPA